MKHGCSNGSNKSSKLSRWAPMIEFFRHFVQFRKDVFFDEFLVRQKVGPKSQFSMMFVPKARLDDFLGRGRRERRRAREEKELGFLKIEEHSV